MSDRPSFVKERKKIALDNTKLRLSAPTPNNPGKRASLSWMLVANNPRIVVWTNDPEDQGESRNYGKITANLDLPVMFGFLQLLDKVSQHDGEIKEKIENLNYTFPGGKRSEKPSVVSELFVGKNKDGVIWISVVDSKGNRPRIQFPVVFSDFHHFMHGDGTPYTPAEASQLATQGYIRLLENLVAHLAATEFVPPEPKPQNGGGGRGNWNNNRGGDSGGGGGGAAAEKLDDLPW